MSQKDHVQFIQLIGRLRNSAERHGQHALADALNQCVLHASGGGNCPMGRLIMEDILETGILPGPDILAAERTHPAAPVPKQPLTSELVNSRLHDILKKQALHDQDARFFQALTQCEHYIQHSDTCPLHRYFHPDDPTPPGGESPLPE